MRHVFLLCLMLLPGLAAARPSVPNKARNQVPAARGAIVAELRLKADVTRKVQPALARKVKLVATNLRPATPPADLQLTPTAPVKSGAFIISMDGIFSPASAFGIRAGWTAEPGPYHATYVVYPVVARARDLTFECRIHGASRVKVEAHQTDAGARSLGSSIHDLTVNAGRVRFLVDAQPVAGAKFFLVGFYTDREWTLESCRVERR